MNGLVSISPGVALEPIEKERGFSPVRYFAASAITGGIAYEALPRCRTVAMCSFAVSSWCLLSSAVVVANRMAGSSPLGNLIHRIHAVVTDLNSLFYAVCHAPLSFFKSYHGATGNLQGRPILLVNGYLCLGSHWHYLRKELAKAGLGPIYTMNVGTGKSNRAYAEDVGERVEEIQKETGRNDLILIGHSKGGLVANYYAMHLASNSSVRITDVINIGAPFKGTPLAKLGLGFDALEMRLDSKFHVDLRKKMKDHPEIRFYYIASSADYYVSLLSAIVGDDSSKQLVVNDLGHLSIIFSSRIASRICTWLKP